MFAELFGIADAKDLVEGVAHDRLAQPRRDVVRGGAVALGLTHLGIHEDRTARPEVDGRARTKRRRHEFGERKFELVREGLQKGAAARAAGLVQAHARNKSVLDGEALHVLSADVDHVAHVGSEVRGRALMRERFDFGPVGAERRLGEFRPVARRTDRADARSFGDRRRESLDARKEALQRISFVAFVPGGKEASLAVDQNALHRGAAEIDPEIEVAPGVGEIAALHLFLFMPRAEALELIVARKECGQTSGFPVDARRGESLDQNAEARKFRRFVGRERSPVGDREVGVVERREARPRSLELTHEALAKPLEKGEGTAQEHDFSADRTPAGEARDRLFRHGVEDASCGFRAGNARIEERDEVGLCEDPAARGDRVRRGGREREFVKACGVGRKKRRHLVDEGPGAARAGLVHAQFQSVREVEELCVFAAEFDRDVRVGKTFGKEGRARRHFLQEGDAEGFAQGECARAAQDRPHGTVGKAPVEFRKERSNGLDQVALMAAVVARKEFSLVVKQHVLDGGGSEVKSQKHGFSLSYWNGLGSVTGRRSIISRRIRTKYSAHSCSRFRKSSLDMLSIRKERSMPVKAETAFCDGSSGASPRARARRSSIFSLAQAVCA